MDGRSAYAAAPVPSVEGDGKQDVAVLDFDLLHFVVVVGLAHAISSLPQKALDKIPKCAIQASKNGQP